MGWDISYDVVVIGGGHAGVEGACAGARMGARVLLLSMNLDHIGLMSCNPAIGGLAKGHLVREIDALGGVMGVAADATGIQFRMLNMSKGPAVRAPRCQSDKALYARWMKGHLEEYRGVDLAQGTVSRLVWEGCGGDGGRARVTGVELQDGSRVGAGAVVVTTGTFLDGMIHIGDRSFSAGRAGDPAAVGLADSLRELGLRTGRLKTGTPPRLDGRTVDFSRTEEQAGDVPPRGFSYLTRGGGGRRFPEQRQVSCYITWTNEATHGIIRENLGRSAMYGGRISSVGPRYCPSIEDKCVRFAEKERHQVFLEPEGLGTHEIYVNGMSTSLPEDVQRRFIGSIAGLERARVVRTGYAIEYTFVPPNQVGATLELKGVEGLFLAGQINGTTGYEEAAAQGLLAGVNAVLGLRGEAGWVPGREEAYLGVLVDDLVTKDHREPYRMFTSRAEFRLLLRQDNADLRLTEVGRRLGLVDDARWERFWRYREAVEEGVGWLRGAWITPGGVRDAVAAGVVSEGDVEAMGLGEMTQGMSGAQVLARPGVGLGDVVRVMGVGGNGNVGVGGSGAGWIMGEESSGGVGEVELAKGERERVGEQVELMVKYEGYIARQRGQVARTARMEGAALPGDLDYGAVYGLSAEAALKLGEFRPGTVGQAGRIAGVNPADISVLLIHLKAREAA